MSEHEPRRLKQEPATPDALTQALQALRKGPNDSARLARVSKRLEGILDAPPPPAAVEPAATAAGSAVGMLPLLKLVVAGAVLITPLLWLARGAWQEPAQLSPPARESALEAPPSAAAAPAPATAHEAPAQPSVAAPAPAPTPRELGTSQRLRSQLKSGKRRNDGERHASAAATHSQPSAPSPTSEPSARASSHDDAAPVRPAAPEAQPIEREEITPAAPKRPERQATEPTPAAANGVPARVPSESELLFNARKALPGDAELALHLLSEHAARYPRGQLVPEREVLAIEALRSLGRRQEADARLQRFEARYPDSLHLERLKR